MIKRTCVLAGLALLGGLWAVTPALGQAAQPPRQAQQAQPKSVGIILLPVVFYEPETKLAGGAAGLLSFWPSSQPPATRPSTILFYAVYTQLKQLRIQAKPALYFKNEKYLIDGSLTFERYPNKYWGFGDETPDENELDYTPQRFRLELNFQKKIISHQNLYLGLQYQFETVRIVKAQQDSPLSLSGVPGGQGGGVSGLGVILNWDTRNNTFTPSRGNYFQLSMIFNTKILGSDFSFTAFRADLRKFIPGLAPSHVFAFQLLYQSATGGAIPFYRYAQLGGDSIMRGYYAGRYRDKYLLAFQSEYRLPLWWRFGLVGFFGLGSVGTGPSSINLVALKYSIGMGLRFKIAPREGTNARMDFAFGEGTTGLYFTAGEAF